MTETAPPVDEKASAAVQPGDLTEKLVECREKAGLDIEQAAEELHLSAHILRALEKEDFAHLPEPPYVRGYLRGYAKLADMDARQLIRTYEALRGANPDEIAHHFAPARPLSKVAQPAISSSTLKFIGFGALVLLLGLLSMIPGVREWADHTWSSFSAQTNPPDVPRPPSAMDAYIAQKAAQEREKEQAQKQAAQAQQQVAAANAQAAAQQAPAATAPAVTSTQDVATDQTAASTTVVTPDATAPATPADSAGTTTAAAASAPENPATGVAASAASPTSNTPDAAATTPPAGATQTPVTTGDTTTAAATQQLPTGEINIKMEFTDEVWLQIKGNDKKTLFESLNTAGNIKEFKATTPLNFKVGNAQGVKIYFNGQPFDQAPYVKGSVARFTIE